MTLSQALLFLLGWALISVPVAILVGRSFALGKEPPTNRFR